MSDIQYQNLNYSSSEIEHSYGSNVHIISNPVVQTILARLSRPETVQPLISSYIEKLYNILLLEVINNHFPKKNVSWDTRMKDLTPKGVFEGEIINSESKAICVDLARAGTLPSEVCYRELHNLIDPKNIRQDHIYINRKVDEEGRVVGVNFTGSKIGGGQNDSIVLLPDPMGATGSSLSYVLDEYKNKVDGKAKKYIAMHIIIAPEYIKLLQNNHPDLEIYTLRLDRGLSEKKALDSSPGTFPELEKGLTDTQYIVPGAGGVGEILNNSFV
ncbi:MAG: uracil phosphoribosyltransferase [Bdellovibrionales bacterium]|jgi:uracil phosphoribosyltransferase|nr:uracil phosphoribosyltransferase [Bdellovibrionales bacterium]